MKCRDAIYLMHGYLDQDIDETEQKELFNHLKTCIDCKQHFSELQLTENLIRQLPIKRTSSEYTQQLLEKFPRTQNNNRLVQWLKKRPLVVAASIFIFLFSISIISYAIPGGELKVVSGNQHNLVIEGNQVIVPKDKEVIGDLVVENGNVEIKGEVKGNVTVINGQILMANASMVDGHTKEVDQFFEWILYKVKKFGMDINHFFEKVKEPNQKEG